MFYEGGFWVAFRQLVVFYYACGFLIHFVAPKLLPVKNIQTSERKSGEVRRDALCSLGQHDGKNTVHLERFSVIELHP